MKNIILISNGETVIDDRHVFFSRGPNCWGKGSTALKAFENAKRNASPEARRKSYCITQVVPIDTTISDIDGSLFWDNTHPKDCRICTAGKGILARLE